MMRFRDLSIKSKLSILAVASSGIALALACLGFMSNDVRMLKEARVEQCRAVGDILGFNAGPILGRRDAQAGRELLKSLESQPAIDRAALVDGDGNLLAAYDKDHQANVKPAAIPGDGYSFNAAGELELWHPIQDHDKQLGTLYLCANMNAMQAQLYDFGKISLFVAVVAVNVVIFFTSCMQTFIARPILELAKTAQRISDEGDYSVRSSWDANDEIGGLHLAFNLMLDQIEHSESALQKAQAELEQRVLDRTAQLRDEIAEREKTHVALEHARDVAEGASRAKSEFLANMSHEIRTPLNAVLGFTQLLMAGGDDDDQAKRLEYLELIKTSGENLLGLIDDVLDLSKIESGKLEIEHVPCSPQQILAEVVSVLRVRANQKNLALEYRWEEGVPKTILGDPGRLRQLLVNLIGNAVKFTAQGYVRVVARLVNDGGKSLLSFEVIDSGIGIPQEKWSAIFDPFVQADSSVTRTFGGTGLGLAICRRIVEAMGGTLTVRSEVGKGSVFTATIDIGSAADASAARASRSDIIPAARRRGKSPPVRMPYGRVLVVEDGDTNRKLIDLILRRAGLDVVTAENGKLGVDAALSQSPGGKFDLILMDMQMPVMDGYTAARTLRENGVTLPIVALTAHAMSGDEKKCREAGCSGFVTKPIHAEALLQTVAENIAENRRAVAAAATGIPGGAVASGPPQCSVVAWAGSGALADATSPAAAEEAPQDEEIITSNLPTDDPDYRAIVEEFVERLHQQLDAMQRALTAGDLDELARLAHWLKGAGGSAGFPALTAPAKELETVVKEDQCDKIEDAIQNLLEIAARIVKPSEETAISSGRVLN
jgi:two-component system, sensor histidine kinase